MSGPVRQLRRKPGIVVLYWTQYVKTRSQLVDTWRRKSIDSEESEINTCKNTFLIHSNWFLSAFQKFREIYNLSAIFRFINNRLDVYSIGKKISLRDFSLSVQITTFLVESTRLYGVRTHETTICSHNFQYIDRKRLQLTSTLYNQINSSALEYSTDIVLHHNRKLASSMRRKEICTRDILPLRGRTNGMYFLFRPTGVSK